MMSIMEIIDLELYFNVVPQVFQDTSLDKHHTSNG